MFCTMLGNQFFCLTPISFYFFTTLKVWNPKFLPVTMSTQHKVQHPLNLTKVHNHSKNIISSTFHSHSFNNTNFLLIADDNESNSNNQEHSTSLVAPGGCYLTPKQNYSNISNDLSCLVDKVLPLFDPNCGTESRAPGASIQHVLSKTDVSGSISKVNIFFIEYSFLSQTFNCCMYFHSARVPELSGRSCE